MEAMMEFSIGYRLVYDLKIPGPITGMRGETKFVSWDGEESFKDILYRAEPEFIARAERGEKKGECKFRFEIVAVKLGGPLSAVELVAVEQVIPVE